MQDRLRDSAYMLASYGFALRAQSEDSLGTLANSNKQITLFGHLRAKR